MRRVISAKNCQIDNTIAPLFYKCKMFCIHDSESNRANYYENPYFEMEPGFEKELAQWLKAKNVNEAFSFRFREEMQKQLEQLGIKVNLITEQETVMIDLIDSFDEQD